METERLHGPEGAARAGALIAGGGVVAIPTETVYGLAANALDEAAVLAVFQAKGRPQDNPLIVHISRLDQLGRLALEIPPAAYALAERFWPGPLTMVLKKQPAVPDRTSGGLDTVGIRMPAHPLARAVIEAAGAPLAAPSANLSGRPSPTTAEDVWEDMAGRIPAILDGGPCGVGVESTVVDLTGPTPRILRPGAVTREMIAQAAGGAVTDRAVFRELEAGEAPRSPGMKYRHYAPKAPALLLEGPPEATFQALIDLRQPGDGVLCFSEYLPELAGGPVWSLGDSWDYAEQARRLFSLLRQFDRTPVPRILIQCPRLCDRSGGTVNRLRRAAGFSRRDCRRGRRVLGITGRSGSGKSLLSRRLSELGALVLDADAIYARLLEEDADMIAAIGRRFPRAVIEGQVDRKELGRAVFSDPSALLDLNRITHPRVRAAIQRQIDRSDRDSIVLDVPLLFESGCDRLCDLTAAVVAPRETSLARIQARDGISPAQAAARLDSQPDDAFYRARADLLLENFHGPEEFLVQSEGALAPFFTGEPL